MQDSMLGEKLIRSAKQARDWVKGKPGRVRVTYVPVPQVDVRKLRLRMGLSQTQFAAKFGFFAGFDPELGTRPPAAGGAGASAACRDCQESHGR